MENLRILARLPQIVKGKPAPARGADRQGLITTDTAPRRSERLGPERSEWCEATE